MSLKLKGAAVVALAAWIGLTEYRAYLFKQESRSERLRQNSYFETLDGRLALHGEQLNLRWHEMSVLMPELKQQIEAMRISLKRVEQVQSTAMQTHTSFTTLLRDTVVLTDTLRIFDYASPYLRVKGVARDDSQWVDVRMQDTLIQVVHRGKRLRPWLWFFSPRELIQTVRLGNPDAELRYSRRIVVGD